MFRDAEIDWTILASSAHCSRPRHEAVRRADEGALPRSKRRLRRIGGDGGCLTAVSGHLQGSVVARGRGGEEAAFRGEILGNS